VTAYFGVTARGNFEGRNILHVRRPLAEVARELATSPEALRPLVEGARGALREARRSRPPPLRDEKILAAWNGLMISALSRSALVLGDSGYADRARRTADFVLGRMRKNGRLLRSYKDGAASHNGYLDDHAFVIAGLLDLFEATGETRWLVEARSLEDVLARHYEDAAGGFFMTSDDHERLLAREKPAYDGAEPSGNSVHALNLLRLYEFTTDDRYRQRAERTFRAFSSVLSRSPTSLSEMLLAVDFTLDTPKEIAIVTPTSRGEAEPFLARLRRTFLPNHVLAVAVASDPPSRKLVPWLEGKTAQRGRPTAYVCERRVCQLPTADPEVFARQIRAAR
jgi:hypothetical protein